MNTLKTLLSQVGPAAPTAMVLDAIPGNAITWTRVFAGIYRGTPQHLFEPEKTIVNIGHNNGGRYIFNAFIDWEEEIGTIIVQTLLQDPVTRDFEYTDNALYNASLTVEQFA